MLNHDDDRMREVLKNARNIAVVGHSVKPHRASFRIAQYLRRVGYNVYAVNPTVETIERERSYANLTEIPDEIDIVNVFRRSEYVSDIVDEAIAVGAKAIWTQLGVVDEEAARRAEAAGLDVAMDLCIKVEHTRLF